MLQGRRLLGYLVPSNLEVTPICKAIVNLDDYSENIPVEFQRLDGVEGVIPDQSTSFEEIAYDRYFQVTGSNPVVVPKDSRVFVTNVNLKLPAKWTTPNPAFGYFYTGTTDLHYMLPKSVILPVPEYTLWVHYNPINSFEFSYAVDLTCHATVYLAIKEGRCDDKRVLASGAKPISTSNNINDLMYNLEYLLTSWELEGIIPPRELFVDDVTGQCFTVRER